jgi:flavin reductase (DIM6/NTAB) family NADH-FMN oxidoreductase RutF
MKSESISNQLRKTMQKVPLPVVVVTASSEGQYRGMTCSSFNSISLQPPIIQFSIKLPSTQRNIMEKSQGYAVHLLSNEQKHQSITFSSPKSQGEFDKFPYYVNGERKLPILQGCVSVLICELMQRHEIGDHEVWYSRVLEILPDGIKKIKKAKEQSSLPELPKTEYETLKPLLYYDATYRNIGDEVFIQKFEDTSLEFVEWTHRAHLRMAFLYIQDISDDPFMTIKNGIKAYNSANAEFITHGYNDTITEFFCRMVRLAIESDLQDENGPNERKSDFMEFLKVNPRLDDFTTILDYYSKELLYSDAAKNSFVLPDLRRLPINAKDI